MTTKVVEGAIFGPSAVLTVTTTAAPLVSASTPCTSVLVQCLGNNPSGGAENTVDTLVLFGGVVIRQLAPMEWQEFPIRDANLLSVKTNSGTSYATWFAVK